MVRRSRAGQNLVADSTRAIIYFLFFRRVTNFLWRGVPCDFEHGSGAEPLRPKNLSDSHEFCFSALNLSVLFIIFLLLVYRAAPG